MVPFRRDPFSPSVSTVTGNWTIPSSTFKKIYCWQFCKRDLALGPGEFSFQLLLVTPNHRTKLGRQICQPFVSKSSQKKSKLRLSKSFPGNNSNSSNITWVNSCFSREEQNSIKVSNIRTINFRDLRALIILFDTWYRW